MARVSDWGPGESTSYENNGGIEVQGIVDTVWPNYLLYK